MVKGTERPNTNNNNNYIEVIRETHDPSRHLKTIEDELIGTIGAALGRQGEKIKSAMQLMEREFQTYQQLVSSQNPPSDPVKVRQSAQAFNAFRDQAVKARWELMVHRQAAGFLVNNHEYVMKHFPIPEALPITGQVQCSDKKSSSEPSYSSEKQQLSGQLDWWQRIGRWR